jgi:manganese transport protein
VKSILQISLGLLAAVGGFVDIGDLVFSTQAGASFGYSLLWAIVVGTIGIIVFSEMAGRVAAVSNRAVFETVRERLGLRVSAATLVASTFVNVMTCAAEVGGIAIVLRLLFGLQYRVMILAAIAILALSIWLLPFEWIERIFGFGGLLLVAFSVAAVSLGVDWTSAAAGLIPSVDTGRLLLWGYFVLGLVSSAMMPYEVYFYSSGGVEEGWSPPKDIRENRIVSISGYGIGMLLAFSLMIVSAQVFLPRGVQPDSLAATALTAQVPLGAAGLLLGLLGMFFSVSGASVDTALAGAYTTAQFFGWDWGKYRRPRGAGRFTFAWLAMLAVAAVIVLTGVDPVMLTELSVVFSVVAMPLTYLPLFLVARDRRYMGRYANGRLAAFFGWVYLVLICLLALAAVPLLILTNMGQG